MIFLFIEIFNNKSKYINYIIAYSKNINVAALVDLSNKKFLLWKIKKLWSMQIILEINCIDDQSLKTLILALHMSDGPWNRSHRIDVTRTENSFRRRVYHYWRLLITLSPDRNFLIGKLEQRSRNVKINWESFTLVVFRDILTIKRELEGCF